DTRIVRFESPTEDVPHVPSPALKSPPVPFNTIQGVDRSSVVHMQVGTDSLYRTRWTVIDGNCMFKAFTTALDNGKRSHEKVRADAVQWMEEMEQDFSDFVPQDYDNYLVDMSTLGTWGDNLTLQALGMFYSVLICVLKEDNGEYMWTQWGQVDSPSAVIWLYLSDNHYENLLVESQLA
ncbi:hypothetical protein I317_07995, partial [Kwoniella heveanensis CBS 569]